MLAKWATRCQWRREVRDAIRNGTLARRHTELFGSANAAPTETLWFGPPDHPGRAGLPLASSVMR